MWNLHTKFKVVIKYYELPLSSSAHKIWSFWKQVFCDYCSFSPILTSENVLCYVSAWLAQEGLAHSTIRTYLSEILQIQLYSLRPARSSYWSNAKVKTASMKGIKIHEGTIGKSPRSCLSITPSILCKPKKVWLCNDSSFNNAMLLQQLTSCHRIIPMTKVIYIIQNFGQL